MCVIIGEEFGYIDVDWFEFVWIVDFLIYEKDEEIGEIDFEYNLFFML